MFKIPSTIIVIATTLLIHWALFVLVDATIALVSISDTAIYARWDLIKDELFEDRQVKMAILKSEKESVYINHKYLMDNYPEHYLDILENGNTPYGPPD